MPHPKPILGLLGGPGSGKSFVAKLFAEAGCAVIDADRIAREALQYADVKRELRAWWGDAVIDEQGAVDRAAVGRIVFQRPDELKRLEALVHPRVHQRRGELRHELAGDPEVVAIVEDCPLLLESHLEDQCDALVFVEAPREVRLRRVAEHRGWDADELDRREASQWPLDTKRQRSDYVVLNDGEAGRTRREVRRVLAAILDPRKPNA